MLPLPTYTISHPFLTIIRPKKTSDVPKSCLKTETGNFQSAMFVKTFVIYFNFCVHLFHEHYSPVSICVIPMVSNELTQMY